VGWEATARPEAKELLFMPRKDYSKDEWPLLGLYYSPHIG
jgi:hypothetical protein